MCIWNTPMLVLTTQRSLTVDLLWGPSKVIKLFVKCLSALPDLHTLEIVSSMWNTEPKVLVTALGKEKPQLRRVLTLALPSDAPQLLQYCPNVENLRCSSAPDGRFLETLVASGLNHLTKFSAVYLRETGDNWPSRAYFVSRLSLVR